MPNMATLLSEQLRTRTWAHYYGVLWPFSKLLQYCSQTFGKSLQDFRVVRQEFICSRPYFFSSAIRLCCSPIFFSSAWFLESIIETPHQQWQEKRIIHRASWFPLSRKLRLGKPEATMFGKVSRIALTWIPYVALADWARRRSVNPIPELFRE